MMNLNKEFWDKKYADNKLGWDIGYISTPLKTYIDQLTNKNSKILIPGAGNGYEAIYLLENGFTNVFVIDIALQPLKNIKERYPDFPSDRLINMDFFEFDDSNFDLILEQTFFCALNPTLRSKYADKMRSLLNTKGKLAGLLFDFPLTNEGPPFGGTLQEYNKLFSHYFKINTMARAYNSIKPRKGNELFFIFEKQK